MIRRGLVGFLLAAALAHPVAAAPILRSAQLDARDQQFFSNFARRDDAALTAELDPSLQNPQARETLSRLAGLLPPRPPRSRAALNTTVLGDVHRPDRRADLLDEYDYGDGRALVETILTTTGPESRWLVQGVQLRVATDAQLAVNRFTLRGKSWMQALFLALTIACPLVMLAAVAKVVRTPGLRRKWLWGLLAVIGLGAARMNWTTGAVGFLPINIQILGASVIRSSSFHPWLIQMSLPVFALLILTGVWANPARRKAGRTSPKVAAKVFE